MVTHTKHRAKVLLIDDDESLRLVMRVQLEDAGYEVRCAATAAEGVSSLEDWLPDIVLTDLRLPDEDGLWLLRRVKKEYPEVVVLIFTAFGTIESAVEAMKLGAYDYLTKPVNFQELSLVLERALEHQRLRTEVETLRRSLDRKYGFESIIGRSPALLEVLDLASRAAQSDASVLITGETGTGKELLARAIHQNSARKHGPFVTINCGAIPSELLESELFGHVKGAFTGAVAHKKGRVEMADGGTLFLDEIGELPMPLQVKLLRFLQTGEVEKVGATERNQVDVRVIAATHRSLEAMMEDGTFREDLYYRLAVIPLRLPPLRERAEDIPILVEHFFEKARKRYNRQDLYFAPSLMKYFTSYRWPGNVRELENVIERLVVLSRGPEITVEDLPENLRRIPDSLERLEISLPPDGISLEEVERELIRRALEKFNWNQSQAARYLNISRKTLIYRMKKYRLKRPSAADVLAPSQS